jgi:hypothetical protein
MINLTYHPQAVFQWMDALRRFAQYHNEMYEVLRWLGETAVERMKEGHPPGGPHPSPGETPVYGDHAYIDRTQWLTDSIGFTLEPLKSWDPATGTASTMPTLFLFATAPYASAVEYGVPGHSRANPFFWPTIEELLPVAAARLEYIVARMNAVREAP